LDVKVKSGFGGEKIKWRQAKAGAKKHWNILTYKQNVEEIRKKPGRNISQAFNKKRKNSVRGGMGNKRDGGAANNQLFHEFPEAPPCKGKGRRRKELYKRGQTSWSEEERSFLGR